MGGAGGTETFAVAWKKAGFDEMLRFSHQSFFSFGEFYAEVGVVWFYLVWVI